MKEKFLLYLTDMNVILYKRSLEKLYTCKNDFEVAHQKLQGFLSTTPKTPFCIFLDLNYPDIREEKLPALLPWDRIAYLFHKRAEWRLQGGYAGFNFLKQEGESYFRWAHISDHDRLCSWLHWAKSLTNPLKGIFFVALEAGNFLKKNLSSPKGYQMLCYNLSGQTTRHVIFKEARLLLSRPSSSEEDLKSSLHFLGRAHPDIHENLQVISLVKEIPLISSHIKILSDPESFLHFLASQRKSSLSFEILSSRRIIRARWGAGIIISSALLWMGIQIYQGLYYKNESRLLLPKIEVLKSRVENLTLLLKDKNVSRLRTSLTHFHFLKSHIRNPLRTFEQLSILLKSHRVHLQNLTWHYEKELEIVMVFLMEDAIEKTLASQFELFLFSCRRMFPKSQVQVLSAPFNSGSHEIFKIPQDASLPMAQVKIILP